MDLCIFDGVGTWLGMHKNILRPKYLHLLMELTHLFVAVVSACINDASIKAWFVNSHGFQSTCVYMIDLVRYTQNGPHISTSEWS